ncbi:MAG: hypothetical protein O7B99_15465, partial [Planctomycetota bacterium]|nr:hypothetical protein [Planctomycetota bacterium]
ELVRDRAMTVEVVDEEGNPAPDVPVGVRMGENRREELLWTARTGADGTAAMPHIETFAGQNVTQGLTPYAVLPFPLATPVEVELDPADPPELVRLTVPPTGRVVVHLLDEAGEPVTGERWGRGVIIESYVDDVLAPGRTKRIGTHDLRLFDGPGVMTHVGLGLDLVASASGQGQSEEGRKPARERKPGPAEPGEEVVFTLRYGEHYPVLAGRCVDQAGEPIADSRGRIRLLWTTPPGERVEEYEGFRSDAAGAFKIALHTRVTQAVSCEVHFMTDPSGDIGSLGARTFLKLPLSAGEIPLGDVELSGSALPLLASGVVVERAGEPILWAGVNVGYKKYWAEDRFHWDWISGLATQTAADGSFEIRGDVGPGEYGLYAGANGYMSSEMLAFSPGASDLRIVLEKESALEGSLVVDDGIPVSWLVVEAVSQEKADSGWNRGRKKSRPRTSGRFRLDRLFSGMTDVTVRLAWDPEPLATVTDVWVEEGEVARDPRLDGLDLTGSIRRIDLEVVDLDGKPVTLGYAAFRPALDGHEKRRVSLEPHGATILSRSGALDIEIVAHGYRTERLEGVTGDRKVVMRRGIPVRVRLPGDVPLPEAPMRLEIGLHSDEGRSMWYESIYSQDHSDQILGATWLGGAYESFNADREVFFELPGPGSYIVNWHLEHLRPDGGIDSSQGIRSVVPRVEIEDRETEIVLELRPDAEDHAEVLAAFSTGR